MRMLLEQEKENVKTEWGVGDVFLDFYEVKEFLGEGLYGKVHRVYHRVWDMDMSLMEVVQ
ncbi:MAG: hypothetical protein HGA25_07185 [Clostridiales bacterium]|nr:hypothetical protein [Clostridiales bacterium]